MRFILTKELGRLARWLRILGYDAQYFKEDNLASLIIQAIKEERIILTRNHRIPQARGIRIVVLKKERFKELLQELFQELDLSPEPESMFSRCIICNIELVPIEKEKIKDKVPEYVFKTQEDFVFCPECRRIYWQGTHWGNVQEILKQIGL
ncbi:MAG: Mut7-C RNAse domain-containing protein [Candidatus Omnitrophica bacterium]|nr:Mut7-C RNAse domain-containing protein [Candidatus Omnitrophota bacterium]